MFIVPDLTKLEREKEVELRKELKSQRDKYPNETFKIKKGKIIRVAKPQQTQDRQPGQELPKPGLPQ